MMDLDQAAQAMWDEEMLAEIEDFIEGFKSADLPRHAASGSLPGHPSTVASLAMISNPG
jgi:hypothetical protein